MALLGLFLLAIFGPAALIALLTGNTLMGLLFAGIAGIGLAIIVIQGLVSQPPEPDSPDPTPHIRSTRPDGFYVYVHKDESGAIFYIGKGAGRRAWSADRHEVWERYVSDRLDGRYSVEIVQDGMTEEEALDLESRMIRDLGAQLVNWINPGRQMDYEALREKNAQLDEGRRLTELAKETAKDDPEAAVEIARRALNLVHEYAPIVTETGLIEELRPPRVGDPTMGDPYVIYRLAQCLKRAGDHEGLVREVDDYFARYPDAVDHHLSRRVLKLRDRTAQRLRDRTR